jgi:hypothetical protein
MQRHQMRQDMPQRRLRQHAQQISRQTGRVQRIAQVGGQIGGVDQFCRPGSSAPGGTRPGRKPRRAWGRASASPCNCGAGTCASVAFQ